MSYIGNSPFTAAFLTDTFSGNGSTTAFTLSAAPANTSSILVAISGVLQDPSTYSVSGTTLTFSPAPPTGTGNISVRFLGIPASGVTTTAYRTVTEFTATSGQTTFSVPSYTPGFIDVYRNGVMLGSADYTATSGLSVVLVDPCTVGDFVEVISFQVSSVLNAIQATAGSVGTTFLANGAVTPAKLSTGAPTWDTSGNLAVGTSTIGSTGLTLVNNYNVGWAQGSGESIPNIFRQASSASLVLASGLRQSATPNGYASSFSSSWAKTAINVNIGGNGHIGFFTDTATTVAAGTDVTPTERMRIDSSGNVQMGTTSANGRLTVSSASSDTVIATFANTSASPYGLLTDFTSDPNNATNYGYRFRLTNNTNIYTIFSNGTTSARSDERFKKDIETTRDGYAEDLAKLRVVKYRWHNAEESSPKELGFIAQEVEKVFPNIISTEMNDDGIDVKSIKTSVFIPMLVKAIQEQQAIINDLKARIESLENK